MKYFILILNLVIFNSLFAQKEGNIWIFGQNAKLDFNTNPPTVGMSPGNFVCNEGSGTATDYNGELLFYTNGYSIYDRNGNLMPNGGGLMGDNSTAQILIVKQPGCNPYFYVFTTGSDERKDVLRYSLVDITLNNGLGDVVANMKNKRISNSNSSEKLTATQSSDSQSVWIIGHIGVGNEFWTYNLSETGLSPQIISRVGFNFKSTFESAGMIAASPDSKLIGITNHGRPTNVSDNFQILNFDNTLGRVISVKYSCRTPSFIYCYGIAFSSNSKVVYVTNYSRAFSSSNAFYQYDMTSNDFCGSSYNFQGGDDICAGVKLGPDKRIYLTNFNEVTKFGNTLRVINDPDSLKDKCNYVPYALTLPLGSAVAYGLSQSAILLNSKRKKDTIIDGCFTKDIVIEGVPILNDTLIIVKKLNANGCDSFINYNIYFNYITIKDTIKICKNDSIYYNGFVLKPGMELNFKVKAVLGCDSNFVIIAKEYPDTSIIQNFLFCKGKSEDINGIQFFSDTSFNQKFNNLYGCDSIVSYNLKTYLLEDVKNISICSKDSITINGLSYKTGDKPKLLIQNPNSCDTLVQYNILPLPNSSKDSVISFCQGNNVNIDGIKYQKDTNFTLTKINFLNCDSLINFNIKTYLLNFNREIKICDKDSVMIGNKFYKPNRKVQLLINNLNTCDSLINYTISTLPNSSRDTNILICQGVDITIDGLKYQRDTSFSLIKSNRFNCDSTINFQLKTFLVTATKDVGVCKNDSVLIGSKYYKANESVSLLKHNSNTCDTLFNYKTFSKPIFYQDSVIQFCNSNTFLFNNILIGHDTSIAVHLLSKADCDSTINYHFISKRNLESTENYSICIDDKILIRNKYYSAGDRDSIIISNNILCDSVIYINVSGLPVYYNDSMVTICYNDTFYVNGKAILNDTSILFSYKNRFNCDSNYRLTIHKLPDFVGGIQLKDSLEYGVLYQLSGPLGNGTYKYRWFSTDVKIDCPDCQNIKIEVLREGAIYLDVTDEYGCMKRYIKRFVIPKCTGYYIPNVFSANKDKLNDIFDVVISNCVEEVEKLEIYDRWGSLVFRNTHYIPNFVDTGWDGRHRNQDALVGVYAYVAFIKLKSGEVVKEYGDVTLIR